MTSDRPGPSASRRALVVILVIVVIAVGLWAYNMRPPSPNVCCSSTPETSSVFQVLKTNVTIPYGAGCMVLEQIGHTCPTVTASPETSNSSLRGLELISYQGTDYYAGCFGKGPCGNGSYFNGVSTVSYPNVWFTNSTIFCVSPLYGNYATCPINESLPSVYW